MPFYARFAAVAGRPLVLLAALAMSVPGEYQLAVSAGWSPSVAWLMPVCLSVYAAVAAVMATTRPDSVSAKLGAGAALALALSAQVVAHLIAAGHMATSAFLVAATSSVPPLVVAHMLHLAAAPAPDAPATPLDSSDSVDTATVDAPAISLNSPDSPDDAPVTSLDSPANVPTTSRPTIADIKAALAELTDHHGHVTGAMLAEHFGVSARTGRRYLAMAA